MNREEQSRSIRNSAMERAATMWERVINDPQPFAPVNIYKAACTVKCSEFLARVANSSLFLPLMTVIMDFADKTIDIVGEHSASSQREGTRCAIVLENEMPLTDEVFANPVAYAERQHVFDSILMLAGAELGKAPETAAAIERLQNDMGEVFAIAALKSITEIEPFAGSEDRRYE